MTSFQMDSHSKSEMPGRDRNWQWLTFDVCHLATDPDLGKKL